MNAHRQRLDTPTALIEHATDVLARIQRVAVKAGTEGRLLLMGELSLVAVRLDLIEQAVFKAARGTLADPTPKQLPKAQRERLEFHGGRGLRALPAPKRRTYEQGHASH